MGSGVDATPEYLGPPQTPPQTRVLMADAMSPASKKRQQTKDAKAADRLRDEKAFKAKRAAQERQRLANKKAREAAEAAEKAAAAERAAATAGSAAAAAGVTRAHGCICTSTSMYYSSHLQVSIKLV